VASKKKNSPAGGPRASAKVRPPLGRQAWLTAAREALIREGIAGVQVGKLARRLKVTRGGFYWFFSSQAQLLEELLADWERTNTEAMKAVLVGAGHDGMAELHAVVDMMLTGHTYIPAWDAAVRDWGRQSSKAAKAVRRVDAARIDVFKQIFLDMGCGDDEAFVRARIAYFHQVGYQTLGVQEPHEQRMRLLPLYLRYLTGR
jgi:AcrR family transcriptional regulator